MAFYTAGRDRWQVDIYYHQLSPVLADTDAAVTFAARAAASC